jgi:hypothetical protein
VNKLIDGLRRATSRDPVAAPAVQFKSALALGHVWALAELWRQLDLDALGPVMRRARSEVDALALVRAMVFNRLCDPKDRTDEAPFPSLGSACPVQSKAKKGGGAGHRVQPRPIQAAKSEVGLTTGQGLQRLVLEGSSLDRRNRGHHRVSP